MSDRYTLAEARAFIDAETCKKDGWELLDGYLPWCSTHDQPFLPDDPFCTTAPAELVAVAAQLLATVERVQALLDEADRWRPYPSRDIGSAYLAESVQDFWGELREAINGEEVTE